MKVLLVNDIQKNDDSLGDKLSSEVIDCINSSKAECTNYSADITKMHHCIGCFSCWIKTPGICIFDDLGREICRKFVNSDAVVIISKVRYGTYSVPIRRTLDRLLPDIMPYFTIRKNGEIHHKERYKKYPKLIFIGYSDSIDEGEKDTFRKLTTANAINFCSDECSTFICSNEAEIHSVSEKTSDLIKELI